MPENLEPVLAELRAENALKAWSVIITFFGDSIAPRGGAVAASTIQEVMGALNIGSGTVRTALSRLCKDGWVKRTKNGRHSYYRLSKRGRDEFAEASAKIYQTPGAVVKIHRDRFIVIPNPQRPLANSILDRSCRLSGQGIVITQADALTVEQLINDNHLVARLESNTLPDWASQLLISQPVTQRYNSLCTRTSLLAQTRISTPLQALIIRTVLIHEWRRLRLRDETPTLAMIGIQTPQDICHRQVADLYHQLSDKAEQWLNTHAQGPDGLLTASNIVINDRFR